MAARLPRSSSARGRAECRGGSGARAAVVLLQRSRPIGLPDHLAVRRSRRSREYGVMLLEHTEQTRSGFGISGPGVSMALSPRAAAMSKAACAHCAKGWNWLAKPSSCLGSCCCAVSMRCISATSARVAEAIEIVDAHAGSLRSARRRLVCARASAHQGGTADEGRQPERGRRCRSPAASLARRGEPAGCTRLGASSCHQPRASLGRSGRQAEALTLLAPVYARFTEGFATADLRTARAMLDSLKS